jgi:hypothetical protein
MAFAHIGLETIPAASSAEETAAGQCRRPAGHGPISITGRRPEPGVMVAVNKRDYTHDSGPVWFLAESRAIGC